MTTKLSAPTIVGELRDWTVTRKRGGTHPNGIILSVEGRVYNHKDFEDGTFVRVKEVTESDFLGRYLFGKGYGKARVYYVAYKISMKEEK